MSDDIILLYCRRHDEWYDEEVGCPGCWHDFKVSAKEWGDD